MQTNTNMITIAVAVVIIAMLTIPVNANVMALQITGTLKLADIQVAPNGKVYEISNIVIKGLNSKLGKPIEMIALGTNKPVVTIGDTTMTTILNTIKTQLTPTEQKMIPFTLTTTPETVKNVGGQQTFTAKGVSILNHVVSTQATSEAIINTGGETGTLSIEIPN